MANNIFSTIPSHSVSLDIMILDKCSEIEAFRPKVISVIPSLGSKYVDANTTEIRVVFDRPMKNGWVLIQSKTGPEHFPELTGGKRYKPFDGTGTIFTLKVKLKPNCAYAFDLNKETASGFMSREGVPLKPFKIEFSTGS